MESFKPRSARWPRLPKVALTVRLDEPYYAALERYRAKYGRTQAGQIQLALKQLPGFAYMLEQEKAIYDSKVKNHHKIDVVVSKIQADQDVNRA